MMRQRSPKSNQDQHPIKTEVQDTASAKEDLEERVAVLELKVAYQERLNQELSDQVYGLHREVDVLRRGLTSLKRALERRDEEGLNIGPADEPPPHY